jgi:hypothetical protein
MKKHLVYAVFGAAVAVALGTEWFGDKPKGGFVPDEKTAIKIAVAVWEPIFGEDQVAREKPYRVHLLTNDVWRVEGSLPKPQSGSLTLGGVMTAEISKADGKVLRVYHTK